MSSLPLVCTGIKHNQTPQLSHALKKVTFYSGHLKHLNKMHMLYTGDPHDICAISFTPVADIEHPVGFDSTHAFECECIVEWLTKSRCTNPITSEIIGPIPISSVLKPLIIGECLNVDAMEHTIEILKTAGNAIDSEHIAQPPDEFGNAQPPTQWQKKIRSDVQMALIYTFFHVLLHILTSTITLYQTGFTVIVEICLIFYNAHSFCKDYHVNGHLIVLLSVLLYTVHISHQYIVSNVPTLFQIKTMQMHIDAVGFIVMFAKFFVDLATILLKYDIR